MEKENKLQDQYTPDYVVTPGDILEEYIDSQQMTQTELAARTGLSKKTINEIVQAKTPITPETALKLELVLGRPAHFWNHLERQYQEHKARFAEMKKKENHLQWLKFFPIAKMIKLGWLAKMHNKPDQLDELLRFLGIASPEQWPLVFRGYQISTEYRRTNTLEKNKESISVWLRKGSIEAQNISCLAYDKEGFRQSLHQIRELTIETEPSVFVPKLTEICAKQGVAIVFVPQIPGMGVHGATRWHGDRAIIQLSLLYKSNDHLWFTFFHEAGHLLLHGKKDVFLEGLQTKNDTIDEKEVEADKFAQEILIPPKKWSGFIKNWDKISLNDIEIFARDIGIAPGIIVGRLQHREKLLKPQVGNKLKVFYQWS